MKIYIDNVLPLVIEGSVGDLGIIHYIVTQETEKQKKKESL